MNSFGKYIAEFIGTFFLVFFGCGSMILAQLQSDYNGAFIPIIFGGTVACMIYATGHISGAHFNPAVTIAFWSRKKIETKLVPGYIAAQIVAAVIASWLHSLIWGFSHGFGKTVISVGTPVGFLLEVIQSFALMFVIYSVATDSKAAPGFAGLAIGGTVALCSFVGGPLTNASMNPARSFGPALLSGDFNHFWLYIIAPIIGAILGAWTYKKIK